MQEQQQTEMNVAAAEAKTAFAQAAPEPPFDPPAQPQAESQPEPEEPEPQKADTEKDKPRMRLPAVMANEQKYLQANDLEGRYRLAQAFYKSGMVPKSYRDGASVFAGMELALELGLKPFTALKNIAVINGTPAIWGDLPLALVRRSGKLENMQEFLFDKDYRQICFANKNLHVEPYGAICRTKMKGSEEWYETVFTMDDAKRAGLYPGKPDSAWAKYPRRMMQMRSRSQNLKDQAGDILLGIDIAEYDFNHVPLKDVTPEGTINRDGSISRDVAGEINKTLEAH